MKIRSNFVSNSSSSSFVMVVTEEEYKKVVAKHAPLIQAILKNIMKLEIIFGKRCMVYATSSSVYQWENLNRKKIIEDAKIIANGESIMPGLNEGDLTDRDKLDRIITDNVYEYSVVKHFKRTPKDRIWKHEMDW